MSAFPPKANVACAPMIERLGLSCAPGTERPGDKDDDQGQGEAVPGHGVLQVLVGQLHHELARLGQAARRRRRFLLDIERRGGPSP